MLNLASIKAITLDLDDTLWPIWPMIERAEKRLHAWLAEHAPATAVLLSDPHMRREVRATTAPAASGDDDIDAIIRRAAQAAAKALRMTPNNASVTLHRARKVFARQDTPAFRALGPNAYVDALRKRLARPAKAK